ncbi:MAG: ParA family protein [Gemmatimonadaceae bacterium]|jgi:chromosome partitioning protein|nr:ParA family protein [Gemmatimonadaceae bacterium]
MSRMISIALQKGGVGKTTCSVNLAGALAGHRGLRTLLIDFDGQTNATTTLLGRGYAATGDVWNVLYDGQAIEDLMIPAPQHPNLFVLPGSPELAYWEKKLSEDQWDALVFEGRRILRERIPADIDVVLIDTPPSLGLWLQIAIAASDGVLLVVQPHEYSADGVRDLMRTVHAIQAKVNPDLVVDGLIINGVRPTTGEHAAWIEEYRRQFGDAVLEPPLAERIVIAEAQRAKSPLEFYQSRGAAEARGWFRQIADQLVVRTGLAPAPTAAAPTRTRTPKRRGAVPSPAPLAAAATLEPAVEG